VLGTSRPRPDNWSLMQLCFLPLAPSERLTLRCEASYYHPSMPTYEYVCEKCGHQFELVQSMKDKPLRVCPKELCGQQPWGRGKVKRLLGTGANLIFKGSGFYINDYRSDKYKEAAKKDKPPTASPSAGGSGDSKSSPAKAESKPAAATKPAPGAGGK
ncbi:MAG: hypothetical protein NTW03_12110, partial [Verrucomicrobia bacterium]|nr:hypothetical protein [Verrucomicrobiota bacterium]